MQLTFQATPPSVNDPQPWPVLVNEAGDVLAGRPDARALVGFQDFRDVQVLGVLASDVFEFKNPDMIIGMFPVYSSTVGGLFSTGNPITSAALTN